MSWNNDTIGKSSKLALSCTQHHTTDLQKGGMEWNGGEGDSKQTFSDDFTASGGDGFGGNGFETAGGDGFGGSDEISGGCRNCVRTSQPQSEYLMTKDYAGRRRVCDFHCCPYDTMLIHSVTLPVNVLKYAL